MTTFLSIFANDILPIFLIAGLGYLLASGLGTSVKTLSQVVFYALSPCLVFNLLVTSTTSAPQALRMALLAVLVTAVMGVIARVAAIPLRLPRAELSAFLLVVMFSNSGNYGLPVVLFAFGTEALAQGTVYFITSSILVNTVGIFIAASGRRNVGQAIVGLAKVPSIYGAVAALIVVATGVSVPLGVMRPIGLLSDAALPLMVLVLGMQLERARKIERPGAVAMAVGLSLILAPVVVLTLAMMMGLSGAALQAGVILASTPVAVVTTILALEFNLAPTFVTNAVLVSTLLGPFTLTALIAYLR